MGLYPFNDLAKIELDDAGAFSAKAGDSATDGILVELPAFWTHYGFYSFAFENSFMNEEDLKKVAEFWEGQIGKRVYWLALSEKGAILKEENGKRYAYVKFTSLIAGSEPDEKAESVLDKHNGGFSA